MLGLMMLLSIAAEITLIFGAVLLIAAGRSQRLRVLLFRCAFVIALIAPLMLFSPAPKLALRTVDIETFAAQRLAPLQTSAEPAAAEPQSQAPHSMPPIVMFGFVWLAGALFVAGRHAFSFGRLSRAFNAGDPPAPAVAAQMDALRQRLGISQAVALRLTARLRAPCAFGWRRPIVLLPTGIEDSALLPVLAHELCHVRNRDALWVAVGNFACALYWFNPLVWMCADRHRADIEIICDDEAARSSVGVAAYARTIVGIARSLVQAPALAGAMMSKRGLAARMRSLITREEPMSALSLAAKAAACTFTAAAFALIGGVQLVAANEIRLEAPSPGNGYIYLDVAPKIEVGIKEIGAWCGDDAHCVFEAPLGAELKLTVKMNRSGSPAWSGCEPSDDGAECFATISDKSVRVKVKAR